jgi:hypothetical protein
MADALRLAYGSPFPFGPNGAGGFVSSTLSANTSKVVWLFQARVADTITHLGFRVASHAGTPPIYRVSLQGVSNGAASGTIKGGASPASATFSPPADNTWDGTWQWVALSNSYACARGEVLAIVVDYSSGTIDASNNIAVTHTFGSATGSRQNWPFAISNTSQQPELPVFGYKSATTVYGWPMENATFALFASNSSPNEYGMRFTVPSSWCSTFTVMGVRAWLAGPAAATTFTVTLYSTGATALQTLTWDSDDGSGIGNNRKVELYFAESSLVTLTAGDTYRLGFLANNTSENLGLQVIDVHTYTEFEAYPFGTTVCLTTRAGGSWADSIFSRPVMELLLGDITPPASGVRGVLTGGRL